MIVLVGLNDERRPLPHTGVCPHARHNPADDERGIAPGLAQDVHDHGGRGGLAVRAGHSHTDLAGHQLRQDVAALEDGQTARPRRQDFGVIRRDGRGDDQQRSVADVLRPVAGVDRRAVARQRRRQVIKLPVGAGYAEAALEHHPGDGR